MILIVEGPRYNWFNLIEISIKALDLVSQVSSGPTSPDSIGSVIVSGAWFEHGQLKAALIRTDNDNFHRVEVDICLTDGHFLCHCLKVGMTSRHGFRFNLHTNIDIDPSLALF